MTTPKTRSITTNLPTGRLAKVASALSGLTGRTILFDSEETKTDMQGRIHLPQSLGLAMAAGDKVAEQLLFGKVAHEKGHDMVEARLQNMKNASLNVQCSEEIAEMAREVTDYAKTSKHKAVSLLRLIQKIEFRHGKIGHGWFNAIEDIRMEREQELDGEQKYMDLNRQIAYTKWLEWKETGKFSLSPITVVQVALIFWAWGFDMTPFKEEMEILEFLASDLLPFIERSEEPIKSPKMTTAYDSYNLALLFIARFENPDESIDEGSEDGSAESHDNDSEEDVDSREDSNSDKTAENDDSDDSEDQDDSDGKSSSSDDDNKEDTEDNSQTDDSGDSQEDQDGESEDGSSDSDDSDGEEGDSDGEEGDADGDPQEGEASGQASKASDKEYDQDNDVSSDSDTENDADVDLDANGDVEEDVINKSLERQKEMSDKVKGMMKASPHYAVTEPLEAAIDDAMNTKAYACKSIDADHHLTDMENYTVAPDCNDRVVVPDVNGHRYYDATHFADEYNRQMLEIGNSAVTIANRLRSVLQTRSMATTIRGQRRGKLDTRSLHRLNAPNNRKTNVFKRVEQGQKIDTDIMILVDQSGSMSYEKIALAKKACMLIGETFRHLESMGLNWSIYGFTTGKTRHGRYHRNDEIIHYQFKGFGENYNQSSVKHRLTTEQPLYQNVDHESVDWACKQVLAEKGRRKIVLVLSDGHPEWHGYCPDRSDRLRAVIKNNRELGVEIGSIGIQTNAPRAYYGEDTPCVYNTSELPKAVMDSVKALLIK